MRYKLFGRSGLRVSELCLGTMAFGEDWGWGSSKEEAGRIVEVFAEAGGNFIDTADRYTDGTSERYVGEAIASDRERWVLATKYSLSRDQSDPNGHGGHRKSLVAALDASLERLATDYVDLLWLHLWDPLTPVDELMRALDDQVRAGKVLYLGISDAPAWFVAQANTLATERGWTPFAGIQLQYSLLERSLEREHLPMARALDIALTAWGPLGAGMLTGKYARGRQPAGGGGRLADASEMGAYYLNERNFEIVDAVVEVAERIGATPAQVALAWLRTRPGVVVPIVGARRASQLQDNLVALDIELDAEQVARLDEVSRIELGFPYDFIAQNRSMAFAVGDTGALVDDHRAERSGA
jgi:aryl-alcohol dehydrogenase-like predicted oxidoreductase